MRPVILDAVFWIAASACAIAQFFILLAVLRPSAALPPLTGSAAHDPPLPVRRQSSRIQEIIWAVLPALLLAGAFVLAWRAMHPVP